MSETSSEEAAGTRKLPGGKVRNVIISPQADLQPKGPKLFQKRGFQLPLIT